MSAIMKETEVIGGLIPPVTAENVAYGNESVADALDRLPIEIKIVQGTTPSDLNTFVVISDFPTGWSANNTYIIGFILPNDNNRWYSNVPEVSVITTENVGIRVRIAGSNFASRPIKVMLARIV